MTFRGDFEISSANCYQLDIPISNNKEYGGIYVIDRNYNSYDEFIDRMYDMCKALNINLIGHDPQDGLTTTFYFQESSDAYAFEIILKGSSQQTEPEYIYPMNSSIPLDIFEKAIVQYCQHSSIALIEIKRFEDENCVQILTDRDVGMSSILHADKRGLFDLMAMQIMNAADAKYVFHIDLPRHIINFKEFKQNFDDLCKNCLITANLEMETPYVRRLRVTTNNQNDMNTLKKFHEQGLFNVGLLSKAIEIPQYSNI